MTKPFYWSEKWLKLKKFGLDYDDFPTILENVSSLLRNIAIDILKKNQAISFISYFLTIIGTCVYFYVYVFSMIWMVFIYYGRVGNWTAVAVVLSLFSCSITSFTKLIFMKFYARDIKTMVEMFLECHEQLIDGTRFSKNLRKHLRIVKRRAMAIWLFGVINGAIYVMIPFITPGRHFTTDVYLIYGLLPMFDSPNFEIATVINMICIAFGIYILVSVTAFIIIIVGYLESQMQALSEELGTVWNDSLIFYNAIKHVFYDKTHVIDNKKDIMNDFIAVRLRDIIKLHITNINLLHELDQKLRTSLAMEFSIMAFSITAELLGGLENTHLQIPYTIMQIFLNCLVGQRLIDACNNFESSLYGCKWEQFNEDNMKTVLQMLMMSQKTLVLSAGGVAKLDFPCLMMILRSTYSTYTTLKSALK